jgi:hypothetical protein
MVRKVWLPTPMKEAVREYCWRHRTKPSPYLAAIIQEVIDFPERFEDVGVPPAGLDNVSVWINTQTWNKAVKVAASYGVKLSAMVRVAIARDLEEASIPWDTSTLRPRNNHIPARE